MRSAPSVSYPVGRCVLHGRLLLLLSAAGLMALVLYARLSHLPPAWLLVAGGLAWLCWSVWAAQSWWHTPSGLLRWEPHDADAAVWQAESGWFWQSDEGKVTSLDAVRWVLDARVALLVRLSGPDAHVRWIWLDGGFKPSAWRDIRRALWAHAR